MIEDRNPVADRFPQSPGFKEVGGASEDAANLMADSVVMLRDRVQRTIEESGLGLTGDEVATRLQWDICSVRARISDLHALGRVRKAGRRHTGYSRVAGTVWQVVPADEVEAEAAKVRNAARQRASARIGEMAA